jgi:hypothetical protein
VSISDSSGVSRRAPTSAPAKSKPLDVVDLIPFKEALVLAQGTGNKHLLLGNGFSIALEPDIFSYNTLFERARDSNRLSKEMANVFDKLGTTDFEMVMEALEKAAVLVSLYDASNPGLGANMRRGAALLRDVLAETIADHHPERPHDIKREQYASCRRFLSHFDGRIYTLNYDLLLYWTLMQSEVPPDLKSDDGFRDPEDREEDYVVWDVQNTKGQRIFYLHGALHIYDAGADLLKFTWSKTKVALVDQIKSSLAKRNYPLIVTEGTSKQKQDRIQHSGFLNRAYRSFSEIRGSLFIYGHSLAENDEHLLNLIDKGRIKKLFIGIYGDPASEDNRRMIARAKLVPMRRDNGVGVEVHFFDAKSAHVWDGQGFDTAEPRPHAIACKA